MHMKCPLRLDRQNMDIAFKHAASKTMYLKNASKESIVNFEFVNLLQVIEKLTVLCDLKFKR